MSKSIEIITVNIGDSEAKDESVERTSYGTDVWNNCISSEFPIIETKMEDRIATCEIGQPHLGYTLLAIVDMYYCLNGDAHIYNSNGQLCAELFFSKEKRLVRVNYIMTLENYILTDIWKKVIEMEEV